MIKNLTIFILSFLLFCAIMLFGNLVVDYTITELLSANKEFIFGAENYSISELRNYYPNYPTAAYILIKSIKLYKIFIFLTFIAISLLIYNKTKQNTQIFFKIFLYCFCFLSIELTLSYLVDYNSICGLTIQGRSIQNDLKIQQHTFTDSLGINKIIPNNKYLAPEYKTNKEGFRSNYEYSQKTIDSLKECSQVIMFIGDSYTEGCCAHPITKSFVDLIDQDLRYSALNFGVGGTDPLQYSLIAQNYVPALMPDMVIVALCLGNDFIDYRRKPAPNKVLYYQTNYNWLNAMLPKSHPDYAPNKYFKDWEEAKSYYLQNNTIVGEEVSLFEKMFIIPSSFNSFIYFIPKVYKKYNALRKSTRSFNEPTEIYDIDTYNNLTAIKEICDRTNIPFILIGIPTVRDMKLDQHATYLKYQSKLNDLHLHYPQNFDQNDFVSEDNDHFNNEGHLKFSKFIETVIRPKLN
jgi:hypothetical protein